MLKCALQVMRWRDTRAHRPAICTRNRCTHYVQFNEQPLLAEASTILDRSLSHTYTTSGVWDLQLTIPTQSIHLQVIVLYILLVIVLYTTTA